VKIYYAQITSKDGAVHHVVDAIKNKVAKACTELVESGDYHSYHGDKSIEEKYFRSVYAGVLDAIQIGSEFGGNGGAVLWGATGTKDPAKIRKENEALLKAHKAKVVQLESLLAQCKG